MSAPDQAHGFVLASHYRQDVLEALADGPQIPSELEESSGIEIAHVSRALGQMSDEGLVELLVAEDTKKGRLYGLTDEGNEVVEWLAESGRIEVDG